MSVGYSSYPNNRYNAIPEHILQGNKTILEFGCATGLNHLISEHRQFFIDNDRAGRYQGIDINAFRFSEKYLNIEHGDIRTFSIDQEYDIVLALHVLEHIEFEHWYHVIPKLCSFVKKGGYLIIGTPYKEPVHVTSDKEHLVSNITSSTLKEFLSGYEILLIRNKCRFAEDGASFVWAVLRYIDRRITRHPYVRPYSRLLLLWRRTEE